MTEAAAEHAQGAERPAGSGAPQPPGWSSAGAGSDVGGPGWLARIGLAIGHPRWALAIAADRRQTGRSGSDLILAIFVLLAATQLARLASAVWLAVDLDLGFGLRAAMRVLTGALVLDLGLLLVGALALFVAGGVRRNLGQAFDLACVAVLPLVVVDLAATVTVRAAGLAIAASWLLRALSLGWMGALVALAIRPARNPGRAPSPPAEVVRRGRRVGAAFAVVAAAGAVLQVAWIAGHLESVKPMTSGEQAPAIALPRIEAAGALGERVTLAASRGKVTVLDFWATWCKPCLAEMPRLDRIARAHPDVAVIAININDPAAARALFDQRGWAMTLVADDGDTGERYGVSAIPHTVILDRRGVVREVLRGARADLATVIEAIRASE
ncbi:MAG: TlpA family protein disulfide reductase [Deltaproteobacteria bacterium]|nr:MAG: TlpA family protein disulfide reductase [Deltaproteobacteria bacterium]